MTDNPYDVIVVGPGSMGVGALYQGAERGAKVLVLLDFQPESERVMIASPCSGPDFKAAAAGGETLAELALTGKSALAMSSFSRSRLPTLEE